MLSDEEKQAIEYVKNIKSWWWDNSPDRIYSINRTDIEQFDIVLNLIEKQSKEIEELKNGQIDFWISDKEIEDRIKNKFTSNDKIKAKIEEYRRILYSYEKDLKEKLHYVDKASMNCIIAQLQVLQSLLEKE